MPLNRGLVSNVSYKIFITKNSLIRQLYHKERQETYERVESKADCFYWNCNGKSISVKSRYVR